MNRLTYDLGELTYAARIHGLSVHLHHDEQGCPIFKIGDNKFANYAEAFKYATCYGQLMHSAGKSRNELKQPARPPLATLGDCLAETASYLPQGFTKITGCTESFWRDIPADRPDAPWLVMEAATACLEPAPVTIFISAGTPAATAREILKQVSKWLKEHGDELPGLTPREPESASDDDILF